MMTVNKSVLIDLGAIAATGEPFAVDIVTVLRSNLLVQAGSGGGKSWLLRRMIEQTFGIVPQIIIDPEGEFSTLREKFDVILVGKDGDTPADIRSAELLARRILELGVSAVVDLYEMSPLVRPVWVAKFIQAFVDAPKNLWRDLLVYVDEAHTLAPEPGHGAVDSEAHRKCRSALIEFASRGRKRGYGLVAATQRLGKLSKDFAAELKNVLVGQTFMDIDRERAAGSLGIAKADKAAFFKKVKTLRPGEFFAMGRALLLEPELVKIGRVKTQHSEAGRKQAPPPPPTEKIKHLLPQLADLPREAEAKAITEKELRARVDTLERELDQATTMASVFPAIPVEVPVVPQEWRNSILTAESKATAAVQALADLDRSSTDALKRSLLVVGEILEAIRSTKGSLPVNAAPLKTTALPQGRGRWSRALVQGIGKSISATPCKVAGEHTLGRCARALLAVLASRESTTLSQLAILSGYSKNSSGFANAMSTLRGFGLIAGSREDLVTTAEGDEIVGDVEPMPKGKALLDYWLTKLGKCERALLQEIHDVGSISRDELGHLTGYSTNSSGFANALSKLRVLGLVGRSQGGDIVIAEAFRS
jgi:hypothetical protein